MKMDLTAHAPQAKLQEHVMMMHQHIRQDDYYWLRDDERQNPQVLAYLQQENDYTAQALAPLQDVQTKLYEEMVARVKQEDQSVPYLKKGYWFQTSFSQGKEYPVYSRRSDQDGAQWQEIGRAHV